MATSHGIPGIEVYIEVQGRRLKEYNVPLCSTDVPHPPALKDWTWDQTSASGEREIKHGYFSKYIEVKSGTYPCVQFKKTSDLPKDGHHIAYSVQFDDTELEIRHQPPGPMYEDWEDSVDSVIVGTKREQISQRFRFKNLTCIEGDESIGYAQTSSVGTIRVKVYHMTKYRLQINEDFNCDKVECEAIMSQKAVKGRSFSHCLGVETGEKIEDPEPEYYDDFLDGHQRPFAVFDFHYRSQDDLISLGIRTPKEVKGDALNKRKAQREQLFSESEELKRKSERALKEVWRADEDIEKLNAEYEELP